MTQALWSSALASGHVWLPWLTNSSPAWPEAIADAMPATAAITPAAIETWPMTAGLTRASRARAAPNRYASVQPSASEPSALSTDPTTSIAKRLCSVINPSVCSLTLTCAPGSWTSTATMTKTPAAPASATWRLRTWASYATRSSGCTRRSLSRIRRARSDGVATIGRMEGSGFGGLFGDPDELQRRLGEFAEQMQGAQRLAWADNAIKLAVDLTVAAMNRANIQGTTEQQAEQLRSVMAVIFPEAVTLVREAREGLQSP